MRTVVGVFASKEEASAVLKELNSIGIPPDEVSVADGVSGGHEKEWSGRNISAAAASAWGWMFAGLIPKVAESTLAGATAIGAAVGATGGALAGLGFNAIEKSTVNAPDHAVLCATIGLVIAATFGGMASAFYNMGVSHERLALEREAREDHGIVVAAHVIEERESDALRVMNAHNPMKTRADADAWLASGWKGDHPVDQPYPSDSEYKVHDAA